MSNSARAKEKRSRRSRWTKRQRDIHGRETAGTSRGIMEKQFANRIQKMVLGI